MLLSETRDGSNSVILVFLWKQGIIFNPFIPNAPFLYLLKKSENHKVFSCFQGVENGCIGNKWVNPFYTNVPFLCQKIIGLLWFSY